MIYKYTQRTGTRKVRERERESEREREREGYGLNKPDPDSECLLFAATRATVALRVLCKSSTLINK